MIRDAVISEDGAYRYVLNRRWDQSLPVLPWVGLNPSTADGASDDQTVRQMCWFAEREGFGGICVLNLYALRSPSPAVLRAHPGRTGPDNDTWLAGLAEDRALAAAIDGEPVLVVAAWGAHPLAAARVPAVLQIMAGIPLACLGTTAGGHPRHPCRLAHDTPLVPWSPS